MTQISYQSNGLSIDWGFKGNLGQNKVLPYSRNIPSVFGAKYPYLLVGDQLNIGRVVLMLWLISVLYMLPFQYRGNVYMPLCSFANGSMNMVRWSPCSITLYVCHVPSDVGSASPFRLLNFSPRSVLYCTLWTSAPSSSWFIYFPRLPALPPYQPPTPHTPTQSNQSKDLSRLALEKTPWRHLFILTIFRYSFFLPQFFPLIALNF